MVYIDLENLINVYNFTPVLTNVTNFTPAEYVEETDKTTAEVSVQLMIYAQLRENWEFPEQRFIVE